MTLSRKQQKKQSRSLTKRKQQEQQAEDQLLLAQGDALSIEPSTNESSQNALEPSKPSFLTLAQRLVEISFAVENAPTEFSKETIGRWGEQLAQAAFVLQEASSRWVEKLETPNEKELRKKLRVRGEEIKALRLELRKLQQDAHKHYNNAVFFSNLLYQLALSWFKLQKEMPHTSLNAVPGCLQNAEKQVWHQFKAFYERVQSQVTTQNDLVPAQTASETDTENIVDQNRP